MKSKLKFILPVLILAIGGGVYYKMSHKPAKAPKPRVAGAIYVLPQDFLINLADGQFAKVAMALVLAPTQTDGASASASAAAASSSSGETIGTLPEEAVVRSIVTNILTNDTSSELLGAGTRRQIETTILAAIRKQTDVKVSQVLFPDLTVQ